MKPKTIPTIAATCRIQQVEPFHRCLLLEKSTVDIAALRERTARFGVQAVVQRADANEDLLPTMYAELSQCAPTICFLDPNGPNPLVGCLQPDNEKSVLGRPR